MLLGNSDGFDFEREKNGDVAREMHMQMSDEIGTRTINMVWGLEAHRAEARAVRHRLDVGVRHSVELVVR